MAIGAVTFFSSFRSSDLAAGFFRPTSNARSALAVRRSLENMGVLAILWHDPSK